MRNVIDKTVTTQKMRIYYGFEEGFDELIKYKIIYKKLCNIIIKRPVCIYIYNIYT